MSKYWNDFPVYSQLSAEQLKEKAQKSVENAKKKGKIMEPILPQNRNIVNTWWGKAWCNNIERYADYATRLDRGKRYIRSGAVIDLKIQNGQINARVQGNRKAPYKIEIRISRLSEEKCQKMIECCTNKIDNLEDLVNGNFPDQLKEVFLQEGGLFPTPQEINYQCSCPDWALMCKHVAAVLYGVGVRFDENPFLFFELRGIDVEHFIDTTITSKTEKMLENANCITDRMIDDQEVEDVFGLII